jgi:hypothetical protein
VTVGSDIDDELDRQLSVMVDAGCPALAGMTTPAFAALVEPLREVVRSWQGESPAREGGDACAWVIVLSSSLITGEDLVPLLCLPGGSLPGVVDRNHGDQPLSRYVPLPELAVPQGPAYVVFGVDRGDEFRGVRPRDAVPVIEGRGRTPLTIHEGIAFAMQHPSSLERNRCYMLAGSRRGDKRVPALWISGRAPKLGWCWEGNLHTWLGIASAGSRRGPEEPSCEPA